MKTLIIFLLLFVTFESKAQFANHDTLYFNSTDISNMGTTPLEILPPAGVGKFYTYQLFIKVHSDGFGLTGDLYYVQTNPIGYGTFYPNQSLELGDVVLYSNSYTTSSFNTIENIPLSNNIYLNNGIYFTTFNNVDPVYVSSTIPELSSYVEVYIDYNIVTF